MSTTGYSSTVQNTTSSLNAESFLNPKILLLGEKTSLGTATSGKLVENIVSKTNAKTLFGTRSPLYQGLDMVLSIINPNGISRFAGDYKVIVNAIPYSITGNVGVKKIALTGTPINGKVELYVSSQYKYTISITTTSTDTLSQIATKIADALNAFADIPVIASVVDNDVIITAYTAGTWFNECNIEILTNTSALTFTITQTTAGTGDLDLSTFTEEIKDKKFDFIYIPSHLITTQIKEFIANRINILNNIDYAGQVISSKIDTVANLKIFRQNFKTDIGFEFIPQKTNYNIELPIETISRYMIERANKNTQDAGITDYVPHAEITGGRGNPSYRTTAMSDNILLRCPVLRNNFTKEELLELKNEGFILIENNDNNTAVVYGSDLTTYSETLEGNVALMRDVANWDTMTAISSSLLTTAMQFDGKAITTGAPEPNTQQISIGDIANVIRAWFLKMSSKDEVTGITYGLIPKDPSVFKAFNETLERTLKLNVTSGQISFDVICAIITPLKEMLINVNYKK